MDNLIKLSQKNVNIKAITKNANVIVYTVEHEGFLISKRNFNSMFNANKELEGILVNVENFSLPIFKTFRF